MRPPYAVIDAHVHIAPWEQVRADAAASLAVEDVASAMADQAIFGSDWPGRLIVDIGHNGEDFYALPLAEETKRKILRDNVMEFFDVN